MGIESAHNEQRSFAAGENQGLGVVRMKRRANPRVEREWKTEAHDPDESRNVQVEGLKLEFRGGMRRTGNDECSRGGGNENSGPGEGIEAGERVRQTGRTCGEEAGKFCAARTRDSRSACVSLSQIRMVLPDSSAGSISDGLEMAAMRCRTVNGKRFASRISFGGPAKLSIFRVPSRTMRPADGKAGAKQNGAGGEGAVRR